MVFAKRKPAPRKAMGGREKQAGAGVSDRARKSTSGVEKSQGSDYSHGRPNSTYKISPKQSQGNVVRHGV